MHQGHCHPHQVYGAQCDMKVYGRIDYTGTMSYNGTALNLEYIADTYKHGLSLTKGYIGGGYIGNACWAVVTTIQNATDT